MRYTPSLKQLFSIIKPSVKATLIPHELYFYETAITSRNALNSKKVWIIKLFDSVTKKTGYGECSPLKGLSYDDRPDYEARLLRLIEQFNSQEFAVIEETLSFYPSMNFGFETAMLSLQNHTIFDTPFSRGECGIQINGLIWMGNQEKMLMEIDNKIESGFTTLKLKVGALDITSELKILDKIRKKYNSAALEIRLDANGAFDSSNVYKSLTDFAAFEIHSIEQPIKAGNWNLMAEVCEKSPIPIVLDEELIGISEPEEQQLLLETIKPAFIILKPSLVGGLHHSERWIQFAESLNIGWWATSALESNIGLNAIAQWVGNYQTNLPQGLGTGKLFNNNIPSPLYLDGEFLHYDKNKWDYSRLKNA